MSLRFKKDFDKIKFTEKYKIENSKNSRLFFFIYDNEEREEKKEFLKNFPQKLDLKIYKNTHLLNNTFDVLIFTDDLCDKYIKLINNSDITQYSKLVFITNLMKKQTFSNKTLVDLYNDYKHFSTFMDYLIKYQKLSSNFKLFKLKQNNNITMFHKKMLFHYQREE